MLIVDELLWLSLNFSWLEGIGGSMTCILYSMYPPWCYVNVVRGLTLTGYYSTVKRFVIRAGGKAMAGVLRNNCSAVMLKQVENI